MFKRFLHGFIGALIGGVIAFAVMNHIWAGWIEWEYVAVAAVVTGFLGILFGHSIVYTFKSVLKLR